MSEPIEDYHVEFAKDRDGKDIPYVFLLTFAKSLAALQKDKRDLNGIAKIPGINRLEQAGLYAFEISIAKTFDPKLVHDEIVAWAESIQSDIIVGDQKILTPNFGAK